MIYGGPLEEPPPGPPDPPAGLTAELAALWPRLPVVVSLLADSSPEQRRQRAEQREAAAASEITFAVSSSTSSSSSSSPSSSDNPCSPETGSFVVRILHAYLLLALQQPESLPSLLAAIIPLLEQLLVLSNMVSDLPSSKSGGRKLVSTPRGVVVQPLPVLALLHFVVRVVSEHAASWSASLNNCLQHCLVDLSTKAGLHLSEFRRCDEAHRVLHKLRQDAKLKRPKVTMGSP